MRSPVGRKWVAEGSPSTRLYKETGEPERGEQTCTNKFQVCIKNIYVRNAGRAGKYFVVAARRNDGDNTRSIVGRLLGDT